jgi:hypothetical protein
VITKITQISRRLRLRGEITASWAGQARRRLVLLAAIAAAGRGRYGPLWRAVQGAPPPREAEPRSGGCTPGLGWPE